MWDSKPVTIIIIIMDNFYLFLHRPLVCRHLHAIPPAFPPFPSPLQAWDIKGGKVCDGQCTVYSGIECVKRCKSACKADSRNNIGARNEGERAEEGGGAILDSENQTFFQEIVWESRPEAIIVVVFNSRNREKDDVTDLHPFCWFPFPPSPLRPLPSHLDLPVPATFRCQQLWL